MGGNPDELEAFLIYLRELKEETEVIAEEDDEDEIGLTLVGIVSTPEGRVAFIEGKRTYWVKEGEEAEGWKVLRVEEDKVTLYKEEDRKGLILYLGGDYKELENFTPAGEENEN